MKNLVLAISLIILTFATSFSQDLERTGESYLGIQFAKDSLGNEFFINNYDRVIISADSIFITKEDFLIELKKTDMEQSEKDIIIRIFQMNSSPQQFEKEMTNLRKTFKSVDKAYMAAYYKKLQQHFGEKKLKKMLK